MRLAPYPGRGALVARIVISATLTMIIIETFRIPGGVVGALSAFLFSRENLVSTARSAFLMMAAFLIGALFIPIGARFLASTPETHFFWVGLQPVHRFLFAPLPGELWRRNRPRPGRQQCRSHLVPARTSGTQC